MQRISASRSAHFFLEFIYASVVCGYMTVNAMYGTSDRAALKHLFYWLAAATWGHRNCAKSLSSRCTEGQTAVRGIIITLRPDNAAAIAALQERGRATETDGRKLGQPISCQQSGWMCELLAGFVSRGKDGHSADIGAGLMPKPGRGGKGSGRALRLMRRFIQENTSADTL